MEVKPAKNASVFTSLFSAHGELKTGLLFVFVTYYLLLKLIDNSYINNSLPGSSTYGRLTPF